MKTGIPFQYHEYYSPSNIIKREHDNADIDDRSNRKDFAGYNPHNLYVEKGKYQDLKQEILNSGHIDIKLFNNQIMVKVDKFKDTKCAKRTIYRRRDPVYKMVSYQKVKYGRTMKAIRKKISVIDIGMEL